MPSLVVHTPEGLVLRADVAGVGSRLAAALLDLILVLSSYFALVMVLWLVSQVGIDGLDDVSGFVFGLLGGGVFLVVILYDVVFHALWNGQSPGKRALDLRVTTTDGNPPSLLQYVLRGIVWPLDALLWVPVALGLLLIAVTPRCQRLGDVVSGTLVLSEPRRGGAQEPWPKESWTTREEKHVALTPGMAARMEERDLQLLRDVIVRRDLPRPVRERLYQDVVRHFAGRLGFEPAENVRTTLKELYLFARESRA